MPNDLKPLLQHIQWPTITTPDEAIELWLIGHTHHEHQCTPTLTIELLDNKCPQFSSFELRETLRDMIASGSVMVASAPGDESPHEYLVYTGGAWDHKPENTLPVTMQEPATPQAYVVMHGNPATGFTIHGTWASVHDAGDWADQNLARQYDYWVMPMVHAYP